MGRREELIAEIESLKSGQTTQGPSRRDSLISEIEALKRGDQEPLGFLDPNAGRGVNLKDDPYAPIKGAVSGIGELVDVGGGGTALRSGISTAQDKGLLEGIKSLPGAYGTSSAKAPSGKEILTKAGVSEKPLSEYGVPVEPGGLLDISPAGVLGTGVDILADPSNVLPILSVVKGAGKLGIKAAEKGTEIGAKTAAKTVDVLSGTEGATKAVKKVGDIYSKAKQTVSKSLSPPRVSNWADIEKKLIKYGIDPKEATGAMEFGPRSSVSRFERAVREGPSGEDLFDGYMDTYRKLEDAADQRVNSLAGNLRLNKVEAGSELKKMIQDKERALLSNDEITYKKAGEYAPGVFITKSERPKVAALLRDLKKKAANMAEYALDSDDLAMSNQILQAVGSVEKTGMQYDRVVDLMQRIGDKAFSAPVVLGQAPKDVKALKDMYGSLSDAVKKTVEVDISPEFAKELDANNKVLSAFFKQRDRFEKVLTKDLAGEQVFESVLNRGDSKTLEALSEMFKDNPQALGPLKASLLRSMEKRSADEVLQFGQTLKNLQKNKHRLEKFFSPGELDEYAEILSLGNDMGPAVLSFSGTGASQAFQGSGIVDKITGPVLRAIKDSAALDLMKSRGRAGEPIKSGLLETIGRETKRGGLEKAGKKFQALTPGIEREREKRKKK